MQSAPLPPNEDWRLEALRQTGILDTEPEACFDRLTELARQVCGAPIALITLVDADRQWFKSRVGLEVAQTPRDVSFCAHAILEEDVLVVPDARKDGRFADNPLVTSEPHVRFYAGCPLVTHDGNAIGTFCVIDTVPRKLDDAQIESLRTLARHTTTLLELRRSKELMRVNAERWERAGVEGDREACAAELALLGETLGRWIQAREQAEESFRELESSLRRVEPPPPLPARAPERAIELLGDIVESAGRLLVELGWENPASWFAVRIESSARKARDVLSKERAREGAPPRG